MSEPRAFAVAAHGDRRCGERPYADHLDDVAGVARRFRALLDDEDWAVASAAAYLHETLEEEVATRAALVEHFGERVAGIVALLTDKPGRTRRERHRRTYPDLARDPLATFVKLAERLANVETSRDNPRRTAMYRHAHPLFEELLHHPGQYEPMWEALNRAIAPDESPA